jgi:hypothetical protein
MFEVELPIENGGHSYIDKETQKITPNLLICAKPGQVRHTRLPFKCYYIHMIVTKGPLYDILMSIPNYITVQDSSEFARLFEQLYESHHSGIPEKELLTHSLVLSLVYQLKQCTPLPASEYSVKHNHHVVIEQAIRYIRENLSSELSLALLAEQANFSPIYFHNLFKASVGKTLRDFVEDFEKDYKSENECNTYPPFFFEQIRKVQNELCDTGQGITFHKFGKDFFEVGNDEDHQTDNCQTCNRENYAGVNHG